MLEKEGESARQDVRQKAMDQALYSSRLLEPEYFSQFAEALKRGDKKSFDEVCRKAGVPEWLWDYLYDGIIKGFIIQKCWP